MRSLIAGTSFILVVAMFLTTLVAAAPDRVSVIVNEEARRVDITIEGKPFTSYIWPTTLKKPVLYPLRTAKGTIVTRGYPLEQRPGERVDHPHHFGLWFNYENVNGLDFWNNSYAIPADKKAKYGWIHIDSIGADSSDLHYTAHWINQQKKPLLLEQTTFHFTANVEEWIIDRSTTLTALV